MELSQVLENLCYCDPRNPLYTEKEGNGECFCDNCFNGRSELAKEILHWRQLLDEQKLCNSLGLSVL